MSEEGGYILVHIGMGTFYTGNLPNGERAYVTNRWLALVYPTVDSALVAKADVERVEPLSMEDWKDNREFWTWQGIM